MQEKASVSQPDYGHSSSPRRQENATSEARSINCHVVETLARCVGRSPRARHTLGQRVCAQRYECRMAKPFVKCLFKEIDRDHRTGLEPAALRHLFDCDSGSPSALRFVGQVRERADRGLELGKAREERLPRCRRESGAHVAGKFEIAAVEVTYEDQIEVSGARDVSADDEILPAIHCIFTQVPERRAG